MVKRPRAGLRERWVKVVLETTLVTDQVKLVLIALSTSMTDAGYVSVPREHIAQMLGKHPARITAALAAAREAGLLDRNGGGYRGRTAQYIAVLPTPSGQQRHTTSSTKVTTTRSPIEEKGDGQEVTFFGHLSLAKRPTSWEKVTSTRSPNARALDTNDANASEHSTRRARHVDAFFSTSKSAPSVSSSSNRFAGRRCVCRGLRTVNYLRTAS